MGEWEGLLFGLLMFVGGLTVRWGFYQRKAIDLIYERNLAQRLKELREEQLEELEERRQKDVAFYKGLYELTREHLAEYESLLRGIFEDEPEEPDGKRLN